MSVEFNIVYDACELRVSVDHDGILTIPDPPVDMEYEIAFMAMGGDEPPTLRLMRRWDEDPIDTITAYLVDAGPFKLSPHLLAVDWAEHTLYIYENVLPEKQRALRPRTLQQALWSARAAYQYERDIDRRMQKMISDEATATANHASCSTELDEKALTTMWSAWYSIAALSMAVHRYPGKCADRSAMAFATKDGAEVGSAEFNTRYRTEQAWQVRRFVDVVETLKAGEPWPPMEATP